MNNGRTVELIIKGLIAELPQEDQGSVNAAVEEIRAVMQKRGDAGIIAACLIGAALAGEEEEHGL